MRRWLLLAGAVIAAGCSKTGTTDGTTKAGGGGKPTIAVVTNTTDPFWDLCEAGANKAAKDFDVRLLFRQPERLDAEVQKPIIDAWVKQGVDGLAVSVVDPAGQTKSLALIAKKIPLVTMDNDAPDSGRRCYIGVDNRLAGKAAGRLVKQALPTGGTFALFIGNNSSANAVGRIEGVLEELGGPDWKNAPEVPHPTKPNVRCKKYGSYLFVDGEAKTDGGPGEMAVTNARDVLSRLSDVPDVCLVGLYAYNPPSILKAVRSKNLTGKVKVVGFDEQTETLRGIASGEIVGSIVQDPYGYGYKSVEVLAAIARGDESKAKAVGSVPYQVITKEGGPDATHDGLLVKTLRVDEFEKIVAERTGKGGAK